MCVCVCDGEGLGSERAAPHLELQSEDKETRHVVQRAVEAPRSEGARARLQVARVLQLLVQSLGHLLQRRPVAQVVTQLAPLPAAVDVAEAKARELPLRALVKKVGDGCQGE